MFFYGLPAALVNLVSFVGFVFLCLMLRTGATPWKCRILLPCLVGDYVTDLKNIGPGALGIRHFFRNRNYALLSFGGLGNVPGVWNYRGSAKGALEP